MSRLALALLLLLTVHLLGAAEDPAALAASPATAAASAPAAPGTAAGVLLLALEQTPAEPWTRPDGTGLDVELVARAAARLGLTVRYQTMPWKRCLMHLEEGRVDGLIDVSWIEERDQIAVWPRTTGGAVDPARRLHVAGYHLYRRTGDDLGWDGTTFANLRGPIANQPGFSVGTFLHAQGVVVDEEARDIEAIFGKLVKGRVQGAALFTGSAEAFLRQHPELDRQVERLPLALQMKPYHLVFSHAWQGAHPALAEQLWAAIAEVRESAEWSAISAAALERGR